MNIILSTTVLASVLAPAFSFSYLDQLGGSAPVAAAPAAYAAPAAPVAAAPAAAAEPYVSGFAVTESDTNYINYKDSLNIGASDMDGPGVMTHVDTLNTGTSLSGGAGIQSHAASLPSTSFRQGGGGIVTHVDALSPTTSTGASYSPFGASAPVGGASSADGASFTLETGDGSLTLTGTIDSISYN